MEDARWACEVGVKWEIEVADNYGKCAHLMPLCYAMLCYAMLYKEQFLNSVFWLSLISPMDMMTRWSWLIPLRETSRIPLLLMGIHSMGSTMGLPMTTTITTTMALIAMALVAMTLTSGPSILCMWVTPALLSKMARLATIVASSSWSPLTMIRLALFMAMWYKVK